MFVLNHFSVLFWMSAIIRLFRVLFQYSTYLSDAGLASKEFFTPGRMLSICRLVYNKMNLSAIHLRTLYPWVRVVRSSCIFDYYSTCLPCSWPSSSTVPFYSMTVRWSSSLYLIDVRPIILCHRLDLILSSKVLFFIY